MIIPIVLSFKADKETRSAFRTNKIIKSHDVNSVEFHITIEGLELTDNHTAKILSIFHNSKSQLNTDCEIVDGKIIYKPNTKLISMYEDVTNYVYVYHNDKSVDVCAFTYTVKLSKIDETALGVKEVYDQSYADLIANFEQALSDYKDSLPQADSVRAEIDEILNRFSEDSQAKLSQYDADAKQVIADNQTAFDLAESNRQSTYEQAENSRSQASEQAIVEWEQSADALIGTVEADEATRVTAETARKTAETDRVSSETTRKSNETARISNENARKSAEVIRLASEVERVNAESVRAEFYEGFDGRIVDLEDKQMMLKNEVSNKKNGWNVHDIDYWSDVMDETEWLKLSFTPTGNTLRSRLYKEITANSGDKIYISVLAKSDHYNPTKSRVFASLNGSITGNYPLETTNLYDFSKIGEIQKLSGIGVADTSNYIVLNARIEPNTTGSYTQFAKPIVINLTGIFGVGNEPTKSEMNTLIGLVPNQWWSGELKPSQKLILNWQLKLIRQNRNALIALGGTII